MDILKFLTSLTMDGVMSLFTSIVAIYISIRAMKQTETQFREGKRIDIKPYFNCKATSLDFSNYTKFEEAIENLQNLKWNEYMTFKVNTTNRVYMEDDKIELILSNIGLGNAINCEIESVTGDIEDKNHKYYIGDMPINEVIHIGINFKYFVEENIKNVIGKKFKTFEEVKIYNDKLKKETTEKIYINLKYKDILDNEYVKKLCIEFYLNIAYSAQLKGFEIQNIKCTDVIRKVEFIPEDSYEEVREFSKNVYKKG